MSKFGVYRGKDKGFARQYASGGFIAQISPLNGSASSGGQTSQPAQTPATNAGTFSSPAAPAKKKSATAPTTPPTPSPTAPGRGTAVLGGNQTDNSSYPTNIPFE